MLVAWISLLTQCDPWPWLSPPPPSRYWTHSYLIHVSVVSMSPAEWWKSWILESWWAGPGVKETMMLSARTLQRIKMEQETIQMKVDIFIIRRFSFWTPAPAKDRRHYCRWNVDQCQSTDNPDIQIIFSVFMTRDLFDTWHTWCTRGTWRPRSANGRVCFLSELFCPSYSNIITVMQNCRIPQLHTPTNQ